MAEKRHQITDAIILKTTASGEINRFFHFISPTLGLQTAMAFGAAKIKSRFCSSVQPFVKAKLYLYRSPKTDLYKLEDISDTVSNDHIKEHLDSIYVASFFCDIFLNYFLCSEECRNFYHLLLYSLELLDEKKDIKKAFLFFTSKMLFLSGYDFNLSTCKKCLKAYDTYFFDGNEGGIFCLNDARSKRYPVSGDSVTLWKRFLSEKYQSLKNVEIAPGLFNELVEPIIFLIKEMFERNLKTFDDVKKVLMK
jgi:DNA repair protein RecO